MRPLLLPELESRTPRTPAAASGEHAVREGHRIAGALVARAKARVAEIETAAHAEGLAQGLRRALEDEGPALRLAAAALAEAAAGFEAARRALDERLAADLPGLAVGIAERILRRELAERPDTLAHLLREALAAVLPATRVTVRLHPADAATIERHRGDLAPVLGAAELCVETTEEVGAGGAVVETEHLVLGAGVPQQIERALGLLTAPAAP